MKFISTSAHGIGIRLLIVLALLAIRTATTSAQQPAPPLLSSTGTESTGSQSGAQPAGAQPADTESYTPRPAAAVIAGEPRAMEGAPGAHGADTIHGSSDEIDSIHTAAPRKADRSPNSDSVLLDDFPRLAPEEYTYAGGPRYTLNGDLPYRESHIKSETMVAFGGALLGLATVITLYQQAWYDDSTRGPFNFHTDWAYSKQYDKAGHMFGGWMSSYCSYESFIACGMSKEDAALWGFAGGVFFQSFMEVQDGFHTTYGFDWTDELSNIIGSGYFYAQQHIPVLQNFSPKWSFGPNHRDSAREAAQIRTRLIVDDYDRQDVWLSAKVHNLLPSGLQPYWPKWLCLALGAGARDVELKGYYAHRTLHLALDYDLVELLPDMGSFGNWLKQSLNGFKFPAPALQLWPKVKFEILYPFRL